jgi:hypothetical protein
VRWLTEASHVGPAERKDVRSQAGSTLAATASGKALREKAPEPVPGATAVAEPPASPSVPAPASPVPAPVKYARLGTQSSFCGSGSEEVGESSKLIQALHMLVQVHMHARRRERTHAHAHTALAKQHVSWCSLLRL